MLVVAFSKSSGAVANFLRNGVSWYTQTIKLVCLAVEYGSSELWLRLIVILFVGCLVIYVNSTSSMLVDSITHNVLMLQILAVFRYCRTVQQVELTAVANVANITAMCPNCSTYKWVACGRL